MTKNFINPKKLKLWKMIIKHLKLKYMNKISKDIQGNEANTLLATDLLKWLNDERNILQNTGQMMWNKPKEQQDTLKIAECLDKTIKYIELSKSCG